MNNRQTYRATIRQGIYLIVLILLVFLFWQVGDAYKSATVQEYGLFETAQSVVLFLIALSFGIQAAENKTYRAILILLCGLALAALIREQDAYFDNHLPYIGWTWCWIFPITGLVLLVRQLRKETTFFVHFLRSHSFQMMMTALIIIIPIAQCLGHRSFLQDLLESPGMDTHLVRRIMEEPIELLGYLQILLASIESALELRTNKNRICQ